MLLHGNIVSWNWNFGDNNFSNAINPIYTYDDSAGITQVELIVVDDNGCRDTTFKQIWIEDEFWIYIPNSFTPDNNGINDHFCLSYNGIIEETFIFNIFNRNSDLVYSTDNIMDLKCMSQLAMVGMVYIIKQEINYLLALMYMKFIFKILKDGNIEKLEISI